MFSIIVQCLSPKRHSRLKFNIFTLGSGAESKFWVIWEPCESLRLPEGHLESFRPHLRSFGGHLEIISNHLWIILRFFGIIWETFEVSEVHVDACCPKMCVKNPRKSPQSRFSNVFFIVCLIHKFIYLVQFGPFWGAFVGCR